MKIGILSDLHLEFRQLYVQAVMFEDTSVLPYLGLPEPGNPGCDLMILAGDIHPNASIRAALRRTILRAYPNVSVIMTEGNHDFYGSAFPVDPNVTVDVIGGFKIAATTMWTHLSAWDEVQARAFSDFLHIEGVTAARWNYNHGASVCALSEAEPDIIVTHHAPSERSVGPAWKGHLLNNFFRTEVDFTLFPKAKLWVHGHVHDAFDYTVERGGMGDLRVVCQPLGYPFERHRFGTTMRVIEI